MFGACNNISEPDRIVEADIAARRTVLIEEFTGQQCTNCPDGHEAIHTLTTSSLIGDSIIAVGIHASPLAMDPPLGLRTSEGEEYYRHFGSPALPSAIFNRDTSPLKVEVWSSTVNDLMAVRTDFTVKAEATFDPSTRKLNIKVATSAGEDYAGNLQVWITENNIVAYQLDHGTGKPTYVHNHVLRGVVNGTWGEYTELTAHTPEYFTYTYDIPEGWNPDNLEVVAFLYNENGGGVAQATQCEVTR